MPCWSAFSSSCRDDTGVVTVLVEPVTRAEDSYSVNRFLPDLELHFKITFSGVATTFGGGGLVVIAVVHTFHFLYKFQSLFDPNIPCETGISGSGCYRDSLSDS